MSLVRSCVLPACPGRRELPSDAYACGDCQMRLVRQLANIEDYLAIVSPAPGRSGDSGPRRPGYGSAPPLRLTVVAMMDPRTEINGASGAVYEDGIDDDVVDEIPNIGADLGGWVRVLCEEHPDWADTEWDGEVIAYTEGAALLRSRCDWIVQQSWVDEFAADIARVHGVLRQACGDRPPRPFAHCPEVVDGDWCRGWVVMLSDGTGAQCRTCRASWRRDQLLELMERVNAVKPA